MGTPCVNNYRALFKDYSVGVVKGNVIPSSAFINITQIGQAHRSVNRNANQPSFEVIFAGKLG